MSTTIERAPRVVASPDFTTPTDSTAFKRHPVLTYFTLTFAISWGGLLLVVGGSSGNSSENDTVPFMALDWAPALGPPLAGILLAAHFYGRAGLREFPARLFKWRVDARWYAAALLIGPLSLIVTLIALSPADGGVATGLMSSDNKVLFVFIALAMSLMNGTLEELGLAGFAIPKMTPRCDVLATGLLVRLPWPRRR